VNDDMILTNIDKNRIEGEKGLLKDFGNWNEREIVNSAVRNHTNLY